MLLGEEPARGTLQRGSSGADVQVLQQRLQANGYPGLMVDGQFGPTTENAVRGFQESKGLVVDGIAGPLTWAALGMAMSPSGALTVQSPMPWSKILGGAALVGVGIWAWRRMKKRRR